MKSEFDSWNVCLYILLVLMYDYTSTRSPSCCKSSLRFLQHISQNQSSFQIICIIIYKLGQDQYTTSKSSTPSFIRCLDDFSHFFQNRKSGFSTIRILITYITKIQLLWPDELGILQYISKWARRTDYSRCSHILSMLYSHMISTADRLLIVYDYCNNYQCDRTLCTTTFWRYTQTLQSMTVYTFCILSILEYIYPIL